MKTPSHEFEEVENLAEHTPARQEWSKVSWHVLVFPLIPIMAAGAACCAILVPPAMLDRISALACSAGGIIGTLITVIIWTALRRRDVAWRSGELGRNTLLFLVAFAWGIGAITGFFCCYVIPRHTI